MDNKHYFDLLISAYNNVKRIISDMMTNEDSRVPDGYTRDDIMHFIIDDILEPDLKYVLENQEFDPSINYERHYEHLVRNVSIHSIRDKLSDYDILRMTPLTSRATQIKDALHDLKNLSCHNFNSQDARDDVNSLQTVLYSLEQTINDDLAEIKSNIEHVQTIQKNNLRPQYPLY